jgi:hypothetical protein
MTTFDPNFNTIMLIVKFCSYNDFDGFLALRLLNKNFREVIDTLLFDVWEHIVKPIHIESSIRIKNLYIIRNILLAMKIHKYRNKNALEQLCIGFITTECQAISELFVKIDKSFPRVNLRNVFYGRKRYEQFSPLAFAMCRKNVQRAKWLIDKGADILTRYDIIPRYQNCIHGQIIRYRGYVKIQNDIDEYINPGTAYGRPSDPSYPESAFFWNRISIDEISLEELTVALEDIFGFTDIKNVHYGGKRKQPLIDKLNQLRRELIQK